MSWFLACFGYSKKRKRRKSALDLLSGHQGHGSYKHLRSEDITTYDVMENPISSDPVLIDTPKERSSSKIKKNVRFNLKVKTYEPIPTDYFLEIGKKASWEKNDEAKAGESPSKFQYHQNSMASRIAPYISGYRYQNFRASYDEEDDIELKQNGLEDDDGLGQTDEEYSQDSNDDEDGCRTRKVELPEEFYSLSMASNSQSTADGTNNLMPYHASADQELKKLGINQNARDRSKYVHSVLNPVENLTQWKAIKARATPQKQLRKANAPPEQKEQNSLPSFSTLPFSSSSNDAKPLTQDICSSYQTLKLVGSIQARNHQQR